MNGKGCIEFPKVDQGVHGSGAFCGDRDDDNHNVTWKGVDGPRTLSLNSEKG